jgi:phenylalanyl-tRNA synthetase beta chain
MKCSVAWLQEWVKNPFDVRTIAEQLTMAGLEIEAIEPVAADFNQVVIGEVLEVERHPNAEKLNVCKVKVGETEPLQIVCGAPNVKAGMKTPTALIGAQIGELKIKQATLRGVESFGMLCSAQELGLAETSNGLLELPQNAPIGQSIRDYLKLDDSMFEINITPNRGDCLNIQGIAREISVLIKSNLIFPEIKTIKTTLTDILNIELINSNACPHYVGRIIRNINPQATTPLWMQEKLRRSGLRTLHPVVDITNYVLLELGQPMHAFDLEKLNGGIRVRNAIKGEKITLLNGQTIDLDDKILVIADHQQPQALAGVMGGVDSAVSEKTTQIFLESAFFLPTLLAGTARRYGLQTDSSQRFERGVDPSLQAKAMERATMLIIEICGGEIAPLIQMIEPESLPDRPTLYLRRERLKRLLGVDIPNTDVSDILKRLEMEIQIKTTGWQVVPPPFRFDIHTEADLIEEAARIYGYGQIQGEIAKYPLHIKSSVHHLQQLQLHLVQQGYQEAITYSFVDPALEKLLHPEQTPLALANPISNDLAVMRTSLWAGLLTTLKYNVNRQQPNVKLFETGLRFENGEQLSQIPTLAGIATGRALPEQWNNVNRAIDFFDVKGELESLIPNLTFIKGTHSALHPGQTAILMRNEERIGVMGALHPKVAQALDLTGHIYLFELNLNALLNKKTPTFVPLSKFPSLRRDVAMVVSQEVVAAEILATVRRQAGEFLIDLSLFDVYQGKGVPEGKKSLAMGLTFQAFSRNLTDADIDTALAQVLVALEQDFQAVLRT